MSTKKTSFDALIIGAGAVGTALARELTLAGKEVVICDKNPDPLGEASSGNTGHFATNFYYTSERAPLEFLLTRRAAELGSEWLRVQENVPRKKKGMLFIAYDQKEMLILSSMHEAGLKNGETVMLLTAAQVREKESSSTLLLDEIAGGLWSPNEWIVDPWLMALSNLYSALVNGCALKTSCEILSCNQIQNDGECIWEVATNSKETLTANMIFNCAGNYSDEIHSLLSSTRKTKDIFSIRPTKGQFLVLKGPIPNINSIIVQVPSKETAGFYLFESVHGGKLVVGPSRKLQDSKEDRTCDNETIKALEDHARKLIRGFNDIGLEKSISFSGLRPACEHDDYQIHAEMNNGYVTVGAIRSTGLTACRAIAEYVSELAYGKLEAVKEDVVMPKPQELAESEEDDNGKRKVKVGEFIFRRMHPLSTQ